MCGDSPAPCTVPTPCALTGRYCAGAYIPPMPMPMLPMPGIPDICGESAGCTSTAGTPICADDTCAAVLIGTAAGIGSTALSGSIIH